jgi:hypothetical protein
MALVVNDMPLMRRTVAALLEGPLHVPHSTLATTTSLQCAQHAP